MNDLELNYSFDDIQQFIRNIHINNKLKSFSRPKYVNKNFPVFYDSVMTLTNTFDEDSKMNHRYTIILNNMEIPTCAVCDNELIKKINFNDDGITTFCSKKCRVSDAGKKYNHETHKRSVFKKYGVENIMHSEIGKEKHKNGVLSRDEVELLKKREQTNIKRYGHKNPMLSEKGRKLHQKGIDLITEEQKKESRKKLRKTNLENYGDGELFNDPNHRQKCKNTLIERYGEDNPSKVPLFIDKKRATHYAKWKINPITEIQTIIELYHQFKSSTYIADLVGVDYKSVCNVLAEQGITLYCAGGYRASKQEFQLRDYLDSIGVAYVTSKRDWSFTKKELDVFLPDYNIGFEMNGLYHHSDRITYKTYHQEKSDMFRKEGIRVIHIWEDEWEFDREKVHRFINVQLSINEKIYARKCVISEVSFNDARDFLNKHHLKSSIKNMPIRIGLYNEQELVALMTFGETSIEYDLNRFVSSKSVVGGFSKLLKHFNKTINVGKNIISYLDMSKFNIDNNVYLSNGFEFDSASYGNYWYVEGAHRVSRRKYTKGNLINILERELISYDKSETEKELAAKINRYRIYGCGNAKFVYKLL